MPPNEDDPQKSVSAALNLEEGRRQLEELEARLYVSEERFRTLVESTSDWIWETDEHDVYTYASPKVKDLLGYTPEEMLGKTALDFMPPEEANLIKAEFVRISKEGKPFAGLENINLRKDGRRVVVETSGVPILARDGDLQGWRGIDRDITERKKIEEEGKRISNRIKQAQEGEQKKIAGAIHDIAGSMLVGLSSSLLLVEEELKHGGANRALVKVYQTKNLVKELVEMMKNVSADMWPPNLEIAGLSGALSALFSQADSYSKIKISRSLHLPDDWEKHHKRAGIVVYRLMQEALNNAMKYSNAKNLEVVINYDNNTVRVSISDDGCGFETDKVESAESGLGLKIMRREIESIGGNLLIDSKPEHGTVIKAEFPYPPPPPGGGGYTKIPRQCRGLSHGYRGEPQLTYDKFMLIRVIIADDHSIVIEGLKAVLKKTADDILIVGEASNGNQALKIAKETPADIYVLDITMPGLNGLETMARLLYKNKKAKIIILSMHDDAPTIIKAFQAGAWGYLVKESATEDIVRALRTVHRGQYYLSPSVHNVEMADMISASSGNLEMQNTGLTSKEREIIQLIAEGSGNKQIAYNLKISINTVKVHRHNIALKLNIHKQTDLVRYAVKEGIIKP